MIKYSDGVGIVRISGLTKFEVKQEVVYLALELAIRILNK